MWVCSPGRSTVVTATTSSVGGVRSTSPSERPPGNRSVTRATMSSWSTGPGHGDQQVLGPVEALVEVGDRVAVEAGDGLDAADDLAAQRVAGEHGLGEGDVDAVVGGVEAGGQLVEDDVPLHLDVVAVEGGVHDDVGQEVDRHGQLVGGHPGVEGRGLPPGEGVHVTADAVDRLGDLEGGPVRRALEEQVLEEV